MPLPAPTQPNVRLKHIDDQCDVKTAFDWMAQGGAVVFNGTYHNARQLLSAVARHLDRRLAKKNSDQTKSLREVFNQLRLRQSQRTSLLNRFLVEVAPGYQIRLNKAPDVKDACEAAFMPIEDVTLMPLRQLLGAISAWEWRKKGVKVAGLDVPIHVHYGVFSPVRGEYLDLIRSAPLPEGEIEQAVDLGTGSGVIAALLAKRGVKHVIGTDINPEALACAAETFEQQGIKNRTSLIPTDTFPEGRFKLIVCNPPWLPGRPTSGLESAVYDPDSRMTRHFLENVAKHLRPDGEGWLIMSDLAERLQLRPEGSIELWAKAGGLRLLEKHSTRPVHPKALDPSDPLYQARSQEETSLWRFTPC